jgi:hypothetical protein
MQKENRALLFQNTLTSLPVNSKTGMAWLDGSAINHICKLPDNPILNIIKSHNSACWSFPLHCTSTSYLIYAYVDPFLLSGFST